MGKHLPEDRTKGFGGKWTFPPRKQNLGLPDETIQGTYSIVGSGNICNSSVVGFDYCHSPVIAMCFSISFCSVGAV